MAVSTIVHLSRWTADWSWSCSTSSSMIYSSGLLTRCFVSRKVDTTSQSSALAPHSVFISFSRNGTIRWYVVQASVPWLVGAQADVAGFSRTMEHQQCLTRRDRSGSNIHLPLKTVKPQRKIAAQHRAPQRTGLSSHCTDLLYYGID